MSKQTAEEIARIATNELVKDITDHPDCLTNNEGEGHTLWEIVNQHIESAMHQYASPSPGWIKASELEDGWNTIDKLPDYDNLVLWWPEDGIAFTDMLDKDGLPDWLLKGKENGAKITHWRQIKGPDDYKYDLDKPSKPVAHGQYKEYGDYLTRLEMEELDARFKTQTAESPAMPEGEGKDADFDKYCDEYQKKTVEQIRERVEAMKNGSNLFFIDEVRMWLRWYDNKIISFSKFVELFNDKVYEKYIQKYKPSTP